MNNNDKKIENFKFIFEIYNDSFKKYGLKLIGKGCDIDDFKFSIILEVRVEDIKKVPKDGFEVKVSLCDSENTILFNDIEYLEKVKLDEVNLVEVYFYKINLNDFTELRKVSNIRVYVTKAQ